MAVTANALTRLPTAARALIIGVVAAGGAAGAVAASWAFPLPARSAIALGLIAGAVALGSQFVLTFPHAGELEHFSLEEAVWVAGIVLAPHGVTTLGAIVGTVAWQYYRRVEPHKIAFNAGQVGIAVLAAELVFGLGEPHAVTEPATWLLAAVALAVCSAINAACVSLAIALVNDEPFLEVLLEPWRVTVLSWLGNVSAGLLAAIAWDASPWGLVLVAVPIALLYLAYRAWLAQTVENELMEDIAHAADEITRDGDLTVRLPTGAAAPRLAALTATLNRMLERIEGAFLRQRHFMRDVAEELRHPVAMLRAGVAELPDGPEREQLREELARIGRVVDDMTSLVRADAPGFIRRRPTPIAPFLEDVVATAEPMLGQRLDAALPAEDASVDIDPERMRQVLLNLLQNAADHGDAASHVVLRAVGEPDAWRFEVADEGGGVPAGHEEAIFEPFYRATPASSGPGLGLALVRTVAGAHGGSAGVVNRPGRGVTFWVRVPS
jgi:signal transduction histidine kinase